MCQNFGFCFLLMLHVCFDEAQNQQSDVRKLVSHFEAFTFHTASNLLLKCTWCLKKSVCIRGSQEVAVAFKMVETSLHQV